MAEAETAPPKDITTVDSENARNEFAQVLKTKRAGPDAAVVRKIIWFWSTLADLDLHGKDSYRVVAAARHAWGLERFGGGSAVAGCWFLAAWLGWGPFAG